MVTMPGTSPWIRGGNKPGQWLVSEHIADGARRRENGNVAGPNAGVDDTGASRGALKNTKKERPSIPVGVQNELWARAAGRCEFRGCNELLYVDRLTKQRSNLATISHIVGYSPDGPRGDSVRSGELATAIRNLMLTCRVHGKIIDDRNKEAEYPESLLVEFKQEHEARVRMLTGITEDAQTHVLLVQAPIDGRSVSINENKAFRALLPRYPSEERAERIDLSGIALPATTPGYLDILASGLSERIRPVLRRWRAHPQTGSVSVFALAPIPLLLHLGRELGETDEVELYQKHRVGDDWAWRAGEGLEEFFDVTLPDADDPDLPLAVILSLSYRVDRTSVEEVLGTTGRLYSLCAKRPSVDFLISRDRLDVFSYEFRKLLTWLRAASGADRGIHVFASVPAPAAVELGRRIKDFDPPFIIYEYEKRSRRYLPSFTLNPRQGTT